MIGPQKELLLYVEQPPHTSIDRIRVNDPTL